MLDDVGSIYRLGLHTIERTQTRMDSGHKDLSQP